MSDVKWIKLSIGIFYDEKIRLIERMPEGDAIIVIWMRLLVLAGEKNMGGQIFVTDAIPHTDETLATICHRKVNTVRMALETFCKFRMIEIDGDKTIHILNWYKHQNEEGLEKIRNATKERVRRFRLNQKEQKEQNGNVTPRYSVTAPPVTVTKQNKKEKEIQILPLSSPSGGSEEGVKEGAHPREDSPNPLEISRWDDAKERLTRIATSPRFRKVLRPNTWTHKYEVQLSAALDELGPGDLDQVEWAYGLPDDHPIFEKALRLRRSWESLMENLTAEPQKIRAGRNEIGLNGLHVGTEPPPKPEPEGWAEICRTAYPEADLPASFWSLPKSVRDELPALRQKFQQAAMGAPTE